MLLFSTNKILHADLLFAYLSSFGMWLNTEKSVITYTLENRINEGNPSRSPDHLIILIDLEATLNWDLIISPRTLQLRAL